MNDLRDNRMRGTRLDTRWKPLSKFCRWITGDWWLLEDYRGVWGVWHPWRRHIWENYRFTKEEAIEERDRRNSGLYFRICESCGTTYASHRAGIQCPTLTPKPCLQST